MLRVGRWLLTVVTVASCGSSYSSLKLDKIQSVAVAVDDPGQRFCAYAPVPVRAVVTYKDGKHVQTQVPGEGRGGRLRTSEFTWTSSRGNVDAAGVLSLSQDALAWFDDAIRVTARVIARPAFFGEATLSPRFDCGGTLDLRGAKGARGGEAEPAGPGDPGPEVQVAVAYLESKRGGRLVLVRVQRGSDPPEHYLVDNRQPQAPFAIDARGGAGGRGGQGVAGVDGAPGIDGQPGMDGVGCAFGTAGQNGTAGLGGGPGGPGGRAGPGGRGGTVIVRYDARFPELAAQIQLRVEGGEAGEIGPGGAGGRGGRGGHGGAGGKHGPGGPGCAPPSDGTSGTDGAAGPDGPAGPDGAPSTAGAPGEVHASPADVTELFADEIKARMPILTGKGGLP